MLGTGKELTKQEYKGLTNYMTLYPVAFKDRPRSNSPNLGTVLSETMDAIQKARQATTTPGSIATLDRLLKLSKEALGISIDMREADQGDDLVTRLEKWVSCPCAPVPPCVPRKLYY